MNVLSRFPSHDPSATVGKLDVERLEPRMMLSTVSISAVGQEGGEQLSVYVDGQLAISESLSTRSQTFSATIDDGLTLDDVRIEFSNDLYLPEQGVDRNIFIESVSVDGVQGDLFGSNAFSTGTWRPEDGISPGFGRGNVLHGNGFIEFRSSDQINFDNGIWKINGNADQVFVDDSNGEVVLEGRSESVSIARQVDVTGGRLHRLSVSAWRDVIQGGFSSDSQPWSTIGVNFYDAGNRLIGQETIEVNSGFTDPATQFQSSEFITPDNTQSAWAWIWTNQSTPGTRIPIRVGDVTFEQVDLSFDTTPTEVALVPLSVDTSIGSDLNFAIDFRDDTRLGDNGGGALPGAILVTGPNGFREFAGQRAGSSGDTITSQRIIYGIEKADRTSFTSADNGTYTVQLLDDRVIDAAGNVTPGRTLGFFEVAI